MAEEIPQLSAETQALKEKRDKKFQEKQRAEKNLMRAEGDFQRALLNEGVVLEYVPKKKAQKKKRDDIPAVAPVEKKKAKKTTEDDDSFVCVGRPDLSTPCPGDTPKHKEKAPAGTKIGKEIVIQCKACKKGYLKAKKEAK